MKEGVKNMEELNKTEEKLIERLEEIRAKENKTLNDREEYKEIQEKLITIHKVMIWIKESK